MENNLIQSPLILPCGAVIKNRLVKAAMTERISDKNLEPTEQHYHLYKKWAATGAGVLITGNVLVDPVHLESAGNIYVGDEKVLPKLTKLAEAATSTGHHAWVQISHAGRQTNRFSTLRPLAPSEVQLNLLGLFGKPRAMTEADIEKVIEGFVKAATLSQTAGFTGIQIHSAHGYLLSQFLSPRTNIRTDKWGGSLENRSRLLITIVDKVRQAVGPEFPISVKLNSSDFQRGGFTEEESLQVIKVLDGKIDVLEISGGTYEKVVFLEMNEDVEKIKESTLQREAYFIDFSQKVRTITQMPIMITGGFRSFDFCNHALKNGELDLIGMARPFITNLDDIPAFLDGKIEKLENLVLRTGIQLFESTAEGGFYARQIIRMANGKDINLKMSAMGSSMFFVYYELTKSLKKRLKLGQ
ncbi:MAG: NADH:flavin oxidoreductase/NADH oxidase family protein [Bacteroidota bacterium]